MKKAFTFLISLFLLVPAFAAEREWKSIGPPGGYVYQITPDRSNPNLWYSNVNLVLYRSANNARSWKKIAENVGTFAVHPKDSSLYIITAQSGIISKSTDRGENFKTLGKTIPFHPLKLDQYNPRLMYLLDSHTLHRSSDEGRSWQESEIRIPSDSDIFGCKLNEFYATDLLTSPFQQGGLYVAAELPKCPRINNRSIPAALILESLDNGSTWRIAVKKRAYSFEFAWDSFYSDHAFAFNSKQIQILNASGWQQLSTLPCAGNCSAFRLLEIIGKPGNLILQTTQRLLLSNNNGKTWKEQPNPFLSEQVRLESMQFPQDGLLAGTNSGGIYINLLKGKWKSTNLGIQSQIRFGRVIASGNQVYTFNEDYYSGSLFFRSDDRGEHWVDLFSSLPDGRIISANVSPHNGKHVILEVIHKDPSSKRSNTNFYISMDGGQHWRIALSAQRRASYSYHKIFFDPVQPNVVYFFAGGLYKSTDFGLNPQFLSLKNLYRLLDLKVDATDPKNIYVTDGYRVLKSTNGGFDFENTGSIPLEDEGDGAVFLSQMGNKRGTFLVDNDSMRILVTRDEGVRWREWSYVRAGYSGGGDPPGAGPIFSADEAGLRFYAFSHGHLFESTNGAFKWRKMNHEFPSKYRVYVTDITNPKYGAFIAATDNGLFKGIDHHN